MVACTCSCIIMRQFERVKRGRSPYLPIPESTSFVETEPVPGGVRRLIPVEEIRRIHDVDNEQIARGEPSIRVPPETAQVPTRTCLGLRPPADRGMANRPRPVHKA